MDWPCRSSPDPRRPLPPGGGDGLPLRHAGPRAPADRPEPPGPARGPPDRDVRQRLSGVAARGLRPRPPPGAGASRAARHPPRARRERGARGHRALRHPDAGPLSPLALRRRRRPLVREGARRRPERRRAQARQLRRDEQARRRGRALRRGPRGEELDHALPGRLRVRRARHADPLPGLDGGVPHPRPPRDRALALLRLLGRDEAGRAAGRRRRDGLTCRRTSRGSWCRSS